jgi:hypothetical protein
MSQRELSENADRISSTNQHYASQMNYKPPSNTSYVSQREYMEALDRGDL